MKAGEDYLAALRKLGLHPAFLGWGREVASKQWLLVMVTSIVDAGGPLALNKLLFAAYNAEATPKEISPFIVRVYSPDVAPSEFYTIAAKDLKISSRNNESLNPSVSITNFQFRFHDVEYEMINAYTLPPRGERAKPSYHANLNDWQKFKRNVEKLAA